MTNSETELEEMVRKAAMISMDRLNRRHFTAVQGYEVTHRQSFPRAGHGDHRKRHGR